MTPGKEDIIEAAERIAGYIHHTPVLTSENINNICGCSLYFKCENLQKAGAFKSRGASNALLQLSEQEKENGVITHSSGNHAGALARAAQNYGIKAYVIMPSNAPKVKVEAVKNYGGIIEFCEPTLQAREKNMKRVQQQTGATEIHPYNNLKTITGQATAAKELMESLENPADIIMAPVGGGGLLSGTALSVKYFSPGTRVIAGEPLGADDAYRSFQKKELIPSVNPKTIADGLLTSLGSITFPIILENVHDILRVYDKTIVTAMKLIWERMKIVVEPSAAVPLAAVLENSEIFKKKTVGIILSGGNLDLNNLPWQCD